MDRLPNELLNIIIINLDFEGLVNLSLTSRIFYRLCISYYSNNINTIFNKFPKFKRIMYNSGISIINNDYKIENKLWRNTDKYDIIEKFVIQKYVFKMIIKIYKIKNKYEIIYYDKEYNIYNLQYLNDEIINFVKKCENFKNNILNNINYKDVTRKNYNNIENIQDILNLISKNKIYSKEIKHIYEEVYEVKYLNLCDKNNNIMVRLLIEKENEENIFLDSKIYITYPYIELEFNENIVNLWFLETDDNYKNITKYNLLDYKDNINIQKFLLSFSNYKKMKTK